MNPQPKPITAWVDVTEEHKQFIDDMIETTKQHVGGVVPIDVRHLERLISMVKHAQYCDDIIQKNESLIMDLAVKVDRYDKEYSNLWNTLKDTEILLRKISNIIGGKEANLHLRELALRGAMELNILMIEKLENEYTKKDKE